MRFFCQYVKKLRFVDGHYLMLPRKIVDKYVERTLKESSVASSTQVDLRDKGHALKQPVFLPKQ